MKRIKDMTTEELTRKELEYREKIRRIRKILILISLGLIALATILLMKFLFDPRIANELNGIQ